MGPVKNKSTWVDYFLRIPNLFPMPLYEYVCSKCNKTFEAIQKFSDSPLETCALCGGKPVSKLMSRTSFQLKGTGWYVSDYKKPKGGSSEGGSSSSGSSST